MQRQNGSYPSQLQWRTEQTVSPTYKLGQNLDKKSLRTSAIQNIQHYCFFGNFFQFDNGDVHQQKANSYNRIHNKVGLFYLTCRVQEHVFLPK